MKLVFALLLIGFVLADYDFDYLILDLFMAGAQPVSDGRCHLPDGVSEVSIHGLWPTDWESYGPNNCPGDAWDASKLSGLKSDLTKYWPTYMSNSDDTFHQHEWEKHGTCAAYAKVGNGAVHDELSYFTTVLGLLHKLQITKALADHNITPSIHTTYEYSDIVNALHYGTGKLVSVTCLGPHNGPKYFTQATACYDKTLTQIDCPLDLVHRNAQGCKADEFKITYYPLSA
ncbi:Ribonuclease T2-like [Carpediemonas membranifera]|uniref:Ribonuclease T2-like n=1 Tax=Carpediemonas membranifera TaxID=201153 RepID=A0A8J6AX18_9EUKA|nr:Ribonuclease T2-like [Carpediemonas membranifera]|eukprot:KAG9394640.1 Ribonuclease T2-like [Carpediemonas membranifera]